MFGASENARRAISRWIEGSAYQGLIGSEVDVDGTLHAPAVIRRLEEQSHGKEPLRTLHQALHELIAYAMPPLLAQAATLNGRRPPLVARGGEVACKSARVSANANGTSVAIMRAHAWRLVDLPRTYQLRSCNGPQKDRT